MADSVKPLYYKGCSHFRQRLVCATLAGRKVVISGIRGNDQQPGLRDFEASFLRLLEKITNGCRIEINMTGTTVSYTPGVLIGRPTIQHECPPSRSIGYFLEPLIMLLPFAKLVTSVELLGVTNDRNDRSVDLIRTVTLPTLSALFGLPVDGLQLKVKKRGAPPLGGGVVEITCPVVQKLKNGNLVDFGEVRRVRGIAYCTRVSPQVTNRMRDVCKSVLTKYAKDVYIYTDYYKGDESGKSPGFALSLVAETTTGCLIGAECVAGEGEALPEDVGVEAVKKLLCEIMGMGCVDTPTQHFVLLYMVLCPAEVSQMKLGQLSPFTIQFMRMLRDFFGVEFRVEEDDEGVVLSCVGVGFENIARKMK